MLQSGQLLRWETVHKQHHFGAVHGCLANCRAMLASRLCRRLQARRHAVAAQAAKAAKPQKKKAGSASKPSSAPANKEACCYGCGAALQTTTPASAGYVKPEKFEIKKHHRQLSQVLCQRCSELCNGAMIPAVADFAQRVAVQQEQQQQQQQEEQEVQQQEQQQEGERMQLLGKLLITPEELRAQLTEVRERKAVVVLLVDLLDASGTLMSKVRDIIGRNPLVLVGTKMDLLPEGCKPKDVAEWLADAAARRRLNVVSTHLVSSHTGEGMSAAVSKICRERKGRDVFIVGAANVGKSAFVRAMLRDMGSFESASFDPAASAMGRYLPVESAMPGTTLGLIPLQAFETGGTLYDTPGVHLHHRIPHMLTPEELRLLHPRKRLRAFLPPTPLQITQGADDAASEEAASYSNAGAGAGAPKPKSVSASYIWSGLVRVDVLQAPPNTALAFYGPSAMRVFALPLLQPDDVVELDVHGSADDGSCGGDGSSKGSDGSGSTGSGGPQVLMCDASVRARGGLVPHEVVVKLAGAPNRGAAADVAVSGLPGWVSVHAPFARKDVALRVWVPRGVEVFLRPALPVPDPIRQGAGSEEDEELDSILAEADMGQLLDSYRAGLDLKALGLEGEEEAVAQLLAMGGFDDDGDDDWEEDEQQEEDAGAERWMGGGRGPVLEGTAGEVLQRSRGGTASSSGRAGGTDDDGEEWSNASTSGNGSDGAKRAVAEERAGKSSSSKGGRSGMRQKRPQFAAGGKAGRANGRTGGRQRPTSGNRADVPG